MDNAADRANKNSMLILYVLVVMTPPPVVGSYKTDKGWRPKGSRCECCISYLVIGEPAASEGNVVPSLCVFSQTW